MTLDFQLAIKIGGKESISEQKECARKVTNTMLLPTIVTISAVAIQIVPQLNQIWDEVAAPWQSFVELKIDESGKLVQFNHVVSIENLTDAQLVADVSVKTGEVIAGYPVTSDYGERISPCNGCSSFHPGVDMGTNIGDPLYAPFDTEVSCVDYGGLAGLVAEFPSPGNSYIVQLLHLDDCTPDVYKRGQKIALSGTAGTGPHLDLRLKDVNGDRPIPSKELLRRVLSSNK